MRVFVPQAFDGIIIGAHPQTTTTFDNVCVEFKGHSKSRGACSATVEMSPHQAICLAVELIHKANKNADDLKAGTRNTLRRLSRKYVKP